MKSKGVLLKGQWNVKALVRPIKEKKEKEGTVVKSGIKDRTSSQMI